MKAWKEEHSTLVWETAEEVTVELRPCWRDTANKKPQGQNVPGRGNRAGFPRWKGNWHIWATKIITGAKVFRLESEQEMMRLEFRMVRRVEMVGWLVGYGKFLFYSMINGEHWWTKQNHNVFCLPLSFVLFNYVCPEGDRSGGRKTSLEVISR